MNASEGAERAGRRELVFVAILLLVGFWLRLDALDQYPLGVHQDELSNIYDGYSIPETGNDRLGDKYPLQVRGFGDGAATRRVRRMVPIEDPQIVGADTVALSGRKDSLERCAIAPLPHRASQFFFPRRRYARCS